MSGTQEGFLVEVAWDSLKLSAGPAGCLALLHPYDGKSGIFLATGREITTLHDGYLGKNMKAKGRLELDVSIGDREHFLRHASSRPVVGEQECFGP